MSDRQQILRTLAEVVQSMEAVQTQLQQVRGPQRHTAVTAAWSHLAKAPQRKGLDPMTNARCNALTQANTALFAAANASTQFESDSLTQAANAMLHIHDRIAGVEWYSLPGTRREVRAETMRMHERAEDRALLGQVLEALTAIASKAAQPAPTPAGGFLFSTN